MSFSSAAVIGTGMMGPGIAFTLASGGVAVTLLSRTSDGAARGVDRAREVARSVAASGLAGPGEAERACGLVSGSTAFEETVAGADLILESGPEDMGWKQELFARLDGLARPEAVLASNTSGLSITAIASRCGRPERVVTTHFWNPPQLVPLVEIVRGDCTSAEVVERVRALLAACGKTPVVVRKDRPGQLGNRLQMALLREAVNIVAEGIADVEAVDAVIKNGLGIRMPAYGLLEHIDVTGTDLGLKVLEYVARDLDNEPRAPEYFRQLVREGHLGARSGRGFYDWTVKSAADVKAGRDAFLAEVLRYRRQFRKRKNGRERLK